MEQAEGLKVQPVTERPVPGFEILAYPDRRILVGRVLGRVSREDLPVAEACLREYVARGFVRVIADLSQAEGFSSNAMGLLAWYRTEMAKRGGCLVLVKPPAVLTRTMGTAAFDRIFAVADSVDAAMELVLRQNGGTGSTEGQ